MISRIGPSDELSDGGGILNNVGKLGAGNDFTGNGNGNGALIGTATGTGKMIGPFFKFFKMVAALAILANLAALAILTAPTFNAIVRLAARNGAVIALMAATFVALA